MPCSWPQIDVARGTLKCGPLLGLAARTGVIVLCLDRPCSAGPPPSAACSWPAPSRLAASSSHCSSLCCDAVDECSVCRVLLFGSSSGRDSQSFQHRTFRPVHACSLDSGLPRYDNLTVSDSPPQHQVLCSLIRHSRSCCRLTTPEASLTGTGTVPACTACSPRSAWVLSPCIATLDSIRVRA